MNFREFLIKEESEWKKRQRISAAKKLKKWQEAILELVADKPDVDAKIEGRQVHFTINGHLLVLDPPDYGYPVLDGKRLSNADPKSALDYLFRVADRRDLARPHQEFGTNYILHPPPYKTADDVFGGLKEVK